MTVDIVLLVLLIGYPVFSLIAGIYAYRNGVTDGYGFAREPNNPGYRRAGEYLRRNMAHRWEELRK